MPKPSAVVTVLAAGMVAATLSNGAASFLRRVGWADPEAFRVYWAAHCADRREMAAVEWQCRQFATPEAIEREREPHHDRHLSVHAVYQTQGWLQWALKLAKDALWLVLLGACFLLRGTATAPRNLVPKVLAALLALYSLGAAGASAAANGAAIAAGGMRSFFFLALAWFGRPLVASMAPWCMAALAGMAVQLALAPVEVMRGMHIFGESGGLGLRAAGTLVHPNSLGIFAAFGVAFVVCFSPSQRLRVAAAAIAAALVFLSSSATGLIGVAALGFVLLFRGAPPRRRLLVLAGTAVALPAVVAALPLLTGRADVFESLFDGRLQVLLNAWAGHPPAQVLFGQGLGVNTNSAMTWQSAQGVAVPLSTDSLLTSLLIQVGIVGAALFYGAWLAIARNDPAAAGFHAVAMVCSIAANVTEVFPANLLMGLAWARGLSLAGPATRGQ